MSNVTNRRGVSAAEEVDVAENQGEVLQPGGVCCAPGQLFSFQDFVGREIENRVTRGLAKSLVYMSELCDKLYRLLHRLKLFNSLFTPTVLYGAECWARVLDYDGRPRTKVKGGAKADVKEHVGEWEESEAGGRAAAVWGDGDRRGVR